MAEIRQQALASGDEAMAARTEEIEQRHQALGQPGETEGQRLRRQLTGKQVMFDGKPVDAVRVVDTAERLGIAPETLLRTGTAAGKFESRLAKSVLGQTLLRAEAGLSDLAATALSLTDRVAGSGGISQNLKRSQALRQEYLNFIEKGGDVESVLGERGNRIYSSVVQSVSKMAASGSVGAAAALPGQTAVLSTLAAENLDTGLNDADDLGLSGGDRTSYALRKATIETGITYLMGRLGQRLGISSTEEMLSPGMRNAAESVLKGSGILGRLANLGGSVAAEAGEEVLVDAVSQLNEISETGASVDFERMIDAGIAGAAGAGAVRSVGAINKQLGKSLNDQNMSQVVKGVKAAESAIENAPESGTGSVAKLLELSGLDKVTGRAFAAATGLKNTSKKFRDHFIETVQLYATEPTTGEGEAATAPEQAPRAGAAQEVSPDERTRETPESGSESPTEDNGGVRKVGEATVEPGPTPSRVVETADVTGARRADMDFDRETLGLEPLPTAATQSWEETLTASRQANIPERALALAEDIQQSPRALSDIETAGVLIKSAQVKQKYSEALQQLDQTTDPVDAKSLAAHVNRLQGEFDTLSTALRTSGTEKGRALNAQKMRLDKEFDLISINSRARAVNDGKPLPDRVKAKLGTLAKEYEDAAAKRDQLDEGTDEHIEADIELRKVRQRIQHEMNQLGQNNSPVKRLATIASNMRAIMASADLSAIGRQGAFTLFSRPKEAAEALAPMFRAARSPVEAEKVRLDLMKRPNGELYERHGLFLHDDTSGLSAREEAFAADIFMEGGWLDQNVPSLARLGRVSQRAYGTYLNQIRADTFDVLASTLPPSGQATDQELNKIARFVNAATGRGGYGFLDKWSDALTATFFAPRFVASRFEMIMQPAIDAFDGDLSRVNSAIRNEYSRFLLGFGTVIGSILTAFGDDEDVSFSLDPSSANFMKLKYGNTRRDMLGGMAQPARLLAAIAALRAGGTEKINGDALIWRFIKTKFSPTASGVLELATGQNAINQDVSMIDTAVSRMIPITLSSVANDLVEKGLTPEVADAFVGDIIGQGVQVYDNRR